jgi:hypothetical protein
MKKIYYSTRVRLKGLWYSKIHDEETGHIVRVSRGFRHKIGLTGWEHNTRMTSYNVSNTTDGRLQY